MKKIRLALIFALGCLVAAVVLFAQAKKTPAVRIRLDSLNGLEVVDGRAEIATHNGRRALHLSPLPDHQTSDDSVLALVTATDFKDGTIEAEVAGAPRLVLVPWTAASLAQAPEQRTPYGTNDQAGHYVQTPDAKLYYERYGEGGPPVVFLHGGEYGYIDEFAEVIRQVSKQRTVIAIATRGYGRSERGTRPLSHRQFAEDAALVIRDIFTFGEKVDVMGFSEGAITSYILASSHPELVRRLVAIGGPLGAYGAPLEDLERDEELTPELMQQQVPDLVARRKKQMTHPEQWDQLIRDLNAMYDRMVYVKQAELRAIKAPTLIMAGDKDPTRLEHFVEIYKLLPNSQMAIIPGCGHVIFRCKPDLSIRIMTDFLQ